MTQHQGALAKNPGNLNLLDEHGHKLIVKRMPNVSFFLQKVAIPDMTLPPAVYANPLVEIHMPGDHITYGNLVLTFKCDEDLNNYQELHNWMRGLGFPESTTEYTELARNPKSSGMGVTSDMTVIVTTGIKNPNIEFSFQDCFPIQIGQLEFGTTNPNITYITCQAIFKYTKFDISIIK